MKKVKLYEVLKWDTSGWNCHHDPIFAMFSKTNWEEISDEDYELLIKAIDWHNNSQDRWNKPEKTLVIVCESDVDKTDLIKGYLEYLNEQRLKDEAKKERLRKRAEKKAATEEQNKKKKELKLLNDLKKKYE